MKFKFKLESYLNVKKQTEENIKNKLGKEMLIAVKEENVLNTLQNETEELCKDIKRISSEGITVAELNIYNTYMDFVVNKVKAQKEIVKKQWEYVDELRCELNKVLQERKILEKYREKKFYEFLQMQLKEESKLTDQLVSYKHAVGISEDNGTD